MKQSHLRALQRVYLVLLFSFMYVPIAVMAVFSFNESKSRTVFTGFTFKWYKSLFHNEMILSALGLSLVVALIAAVVATVVGTAAAIGINAMGKRSQAVINNISYMPVVNPEIITGVSLMLLFVVVKDGFAWANQNLGWALPENVFGLPTLLVAHISFCLPYVIFNVSPKLRQLDVRVYEAALDLGCNPKQAFFKVVLPELAPAILSAFLICLTYSIDDFLISYFTSGTTQTLPIVIYSMTRKKVSPEINALSTVMFLVILAIILFYNYLDGRREARKA
ncbi:MAG TPA: ABC transporter permease [Candidatus Fournierella merdipullorum]|uniref:ABC transporter permease n=1 Tax=Candidatus Allofournierella merdipullorum TaxID=2838595 RepID=A0A9D2E3R7_9FIRM|nr:ABC transporter permease [Candidatus Fournierella merdipullorum]